jgi:3',5'-nucleoside bisphosphate phosphatase
MIEYADLHVHTIYSDGSKTPEEVVRMAEQAGLAAISITDHDNLEGCLQAQELKHKYNVEIIDGVEFSCFENGREFHVMGYNIDPDNKQLREHLKFFRDARLKRAEIILEKLKSINISIEFDSVLEKAGEAPITRPHIASALLDEGYISNLKEAFNLYLGEGKPAYQAKAMFTVEKAIRLINNCGGVSSLAHPARSISQDTIYKFIKLGLDGIECVHPMHDESLTQFYSNIARQYWLLETGGSDYHGTRDYDDDNFGRFVVPANVVESIKLACGKH